MPSIPAKSLAPPEDKLASQQFVDQRVSPPQKKDKLPSYMTQLESSRNPIISPFSYTPQIRPKGIWHKNEQSWAKAEERFRKYEENPSPAQSPTRSSSHSPQRAK